MSRFLFAFYMHGHAFPAELLRNVNPEADLRPPASPEGINMSRGNAHKPLKQSAQQRMILLWFFVGVSSLYWKRGEVALLFP